MRKKILFKDEAAAKAIELYIEDHNLKEDDRIPSERDFAVMLDVQRDTIRSALERLINKGKIYKKARQGCFVARERIEFDLGDFGSIKERIERLGRESKVRMLSFEHTNLDAELAEKTLMPEGTSCLRIMRLRYEDETAVSVERSYLIEENVQGLTPEELSDRSTSDTLRDKYGIQLTSSHQRITQVFAADLEAELLRVDEGEPLLRYEGLVYDRRGRLIEFFDSVLRIETIEFRLREFA